MKFAETYYLGGFWVILALGLFFIWAFKEKKQLLAKFADKNLLENLTSLVNFKAIKIKFLLILLVAVLSIIALMRPQWGFKWREVKREGIDILIALDTSKSMLAEDIRPNRLSRSKMAIKDLVEKLKGDRVGLIAFSGSAYLQCPLTSDYDGFRLSLDDLNTDTIPRGGTSISEALRVAIKSLAEIDKKYKVLILITDGEDHQGGALKLAKKALKEGIKIFSVGIGTKEGELIQTYNQAGKKTFLKDKNENVVKTRLNEEILQNIALTTGGMYVRSALADFGLDTIYRKRLKNMEKRELKSKMVKFYHERFQIFIALAILALMTEQLIRVGKKS